MSKTLKDLMATAKSTWHWELAVASNNLQWNLYQLRKNRGWTQRQLGERLGAKQPHIVRHESWGYMPSMDSLAKYAHIYGVTIAELLGDPMHFGPEVIYDDAHKRVGSVTVGSTAHTITTTASWKP